MFSITGRGTVATGRIETGVANTGDAVDIIGMGAEKLASTVTGVEMFRKILDRGEAGSLGRQPEEDLANQAKLIANQGKILANQAKLLKR